MYCHAHQSRLYQNETWKKSRTGDAQMAPEMCSSPTLSSSSSKQNVIHFKIHHPCFPASGIDWTRFKMPDLDSDIEDNDKVAAAKAKECRRHKVEKKRQEDKEKHCWEEEEKCCREEEERRHREEEAELRK
ncbi:hypothetical protein BU15DRAFT_64768 [Melanogaster broomeanus]|nr:hypothetical protein BU15DRAFT_64768 [Melanogaster broomeanus]